MDDSVIVRLHLGEDAQLGSMWYEDECTRPGTLGHMSWISGAL